MKNILIHGLGQTNKSWDKTIIYLKQKGIDVLCPNLFEEFKTFSKDYNGMYRAFSDFCNNQNEKLNLCGLSLGGILALDFAKAFPEKVHSILLIGTPHKIPKILFNFQVLVFHIMPKLTFKKMGCSKKEFISLVRSMRKFNIEKGLENIKCKSLILCGSKDYMNLKSARFLNKRIKTSCFKIISHSSHEVNRDQPEELSNWIYDFWTKNEE